MLTGHAPFDRETSADTLAAVIYQEPEPIGQVLPNAPIELQRILRKALQKDREERYQSMKDFALDIKDLTYEIEHSNSGGRSGHVVSSPEFSENRTVIHRTISSNHPTDQTNVYTSGPSTVLPRRPRARTVGIGIAAAFLLLAVMGFGIYGWFYSGQSLSASAFEKTQISRINTDGRVRLPAISPDGRYVAYVSGEVGNRSIAVRQISTESEIPVVPASALGFATLAFSPSGDYVYYTQTSADYSLNTLYQVPTFGGPSKKIITDVDSAPTFSPDGKRLAFLRHVSERGDDVIFVANLDGSNIQPLVSRRDATKYDFLTAPAWSPDGSKVLFGAGRINGGVVVDVVIAEASTGDGSFRIFNPKKWNNVESLVWFRDGSGFLLTARDSDAAPMQVWRVAYPSGAIEAVTNDLNNYSGLALSSDGATIITAKADLVSSVWNYSPTTKEFNQLMADSSKLEGGSGITQAPDGRLIFSSDEGFEKNLWISDRDGKNALRLTSGAKINQTPLVTPDGRYIVFNSSRSGTFRVWRMDLDGKNPVQLTEETAEASDFNPVITPDGKSILFNRNYLTDNRVSAIMRVPVEGGASTSVLSDSQHANFSPVISPDGKHLAFMSYDTSTYLRKILVAMFDGNVTGAIESSFVSNLMSNLKWSPDGKSLVYITGQGIPNLWKLSVDGTKPQPLTDFRSGRIFNYAWSRDGKNLLIIRGIVNNDLILIRDAARTTAQLSNPYNASRV
jgi:Tol biopolymer transport system component